MSRAIESGSVKFRRVISRRARGPVSAHEEKWVMCRRDVHERMPRPPCLRGSESLML